jgi:DNA-binding XRE family transcriptional regulator
LLLSQEALAKEVGVSYPTLNRWENGHSPTWVLECKFYNYCKKKKIVFKESDSNE